MRTRELKPGLLTVKEAAKRLSLSPPTLRHLMDEGIIDIGYVLRGKKNRAFIIYEALVDHLSRKLMKFEDGEWRVYEKRGTA